MITLPEFTKDLLTAGFGAFFGAGLAFCLQNKRDKELKQKIDYGHLTATHFLFLSRLNAIGSFTQDAFDHGKLKKELGMQYVDSYFHTEKSDFGAISFLADSKAQFLMDMRITESNYFNFLSTVEKRNFHLRDFYSSVTVEEVDRSTRTSNIRGKPHEFDLIDDLTEHLSRTAMKTICRLQDDCNTMSDVIARRFPNEPVSQFKINEPKSGSEGH